MTRVRPHRRLRETTHLGRHSEGVRFWQCAPSVTAPARPAVQRVVVAELPGSQPLESRLSPPYSPAQAALLAEAAVGDTLQALGGGPVIVSDNVEQAFRLLPGPSLLIGTQTPQLNEELLAVAAGRLGDFDAVLGATTGAGWWAFGLRDPEALRPLLPSLPDTAGLALAALRLGLRVAMLPTLRAVETVADVATVAGSCRAGSRFAATAARLGGAGDS